MAATCAPHVPEQSALRALSLPFGHYLELTGTWQSWDMFTTIPYFHAYEVSLNVTETDGKAERMGVMLPGLTRYDRAVRTETFFTRVLNDPLYAGYLDGYVGKVCETIRERSGHGGQRLVIQESIERLRWLQEIRENGVIANHEEHSSKTFTCAG